MIHIPTDLRNANQEQGFQSTTRNKRTFHQHHQQRQLNTTQRRYFHATTRRAFAPFLPEIIVGVLLGAGWVGYRTSQGKPLTPDEAMQAQQAYQKFQQDVQRRNEKYKQRM